MAAVWQCGRYRVFRSTGDGGIHPRGPRDHGVAVAAVAGRLLSRTDSTESLILTMMLFMSVGGGLLAWSDWKPVSNVVSVMQTIVLM